MIELLAQAAGETPRSQYSVDVGLWTLDLRLNLDPVSTTPGSVFVDPRCQTFCLTGWLVAGHVLILGPLQYSHQKRVRRQTNTEPGAVATGLVAISHELVFAGDPVANTTPRGLPARGPRSAPGSDLLLP